MMLAKAVIRMYISIQRYYSQVNQIFKLPDSLSPDIIKEFEEGILPEVVTHTHTDVEYSHQKRIVSVNSSNNDQDVPPKKPKTERPIIHNSIG